jgi:hypothetical protein
VGSGGDSAPPHRRFAEQGSKLQAIGILGEERLPISAFLILSKDWFVS